jgi:hypothetical protein
MVRLTDLTGRLKHCFDHPTDIIAAIIQLPEFAMVSKSTIKEVVEKVSFSLFHSNLTGSDHFALPAQVEERCNEATCRTTLGHAHDGTRCTFSALLVFHVHARTGVWECFHMFGGSGGFFEHSFIFTYTTTAPRLDLT